MRDGDVWVFDLDGTVLRSNGVDEDCFARACGVVFPGLGAVDTDWSSYPDATDTVIVKSLMDRSGVPAPLRGYVHEMFRTRFVAMVRAAVGASPACVTPAPGIGGLLDVLGGAGRGAIATGGFGLTAALKLRGAGLGSARVPIRCCDDAPRRVEIIAAAACAVGVDWDGGGRSRVVYFGDGVWDRRACEEAGIRFVGVALEGEGASRLAAEGGTPMIGGFEDVGAVEAAVEAAGAVLVGRG